MLWFTFVCHLTSLISQGRQICSWPILKLHLYRSWVWNYRSCLESCACWGWQEVWAAPQGERQSCEWNSELYKKLAEGQLSQANAAIKRKEGDGRSVQEGTETLGQAVREGGQNEERLSLSMQEWEDSSEPGEERDQGLQLVTRPGMSVQTKRRGVAHCISTTLYGSLL